MNGREVEIYYSNLNMLGASSAGLTVASAARQIEVAKRAGYEGVEWTPQRTPSGIQVAQGWLSEDDKAYMRSLQQSYRGERSIGEAWRHPNRTLALVSYGLLPERIDSIHQLQQIQTHLGRNVPVVLFPPHAGEQQSVSSEVFSDRTFQLTAEVMLRWGTLTVDEVVQEYAHRGFDHFCLDLTHMQAEHSFAEEPLYPSEIPHYMQSQMRDLRQHADELRTVSSDVIADLVKKYHAIGLASNDNAFYKDLLAIVSHNTTGIGINPWTDYIDTLLPYTSEIHVSAGRTDVARSPEATRKAMADLYALYVGNTDIPQAEGATILEILKHIARTDWEGRLVVEVTTGPLAVVMGTRQVNQDDWVRGHSAMIQNIRDIFSSS